MTPDAPEEFKDRWIRLLDRSRAELTKVYKFRPVYEEVGQIIEKNGTRPDSEFFDLIQNGYACWQALIVRRQVDSKDTVSNAWGACCTR